MIAPALLAAALLAAPARAKEIGRLQSKDGLVLVFRVSPVSNLVYQLDCLTHATSCTEDAYKVFWASQSWTTDDGRALERWARLMRKYEKRVDLDEREAPAPLPTPGEAIDVRRQVRIASFMADDLERYRANLSLLMSPEDVREALDVLEAFRPRFDAWWGARGRSRGESAGRRLVELIEKEGLAELYGEVARFYGYAYRPGTTVEFDFMAQPENRAKHSSGEQVSGYSVVEIVPEEDVKHRVDVVSHELFHYFYDRAPAAVHGRLLQQFSDSPEPYAYAAFGLFNESVATALGQGVVSRKVLAPGEFKRFFEGKDSFYAEPEVDAAAKALLPVVDRALARGETIAQADFVGDYLDAVSAGVGPRLSSPQVWFRACALVFGPGMNPAYEDFRERARSGSVWGSSLHPTALARLRDFPGLSGAVFLRPEDASELASWSGVIGSADFAKIAARAKKPKPFVYGIKRSDKTYLYVFVGPDARSLEPVFSDFFAMPAMFAGARP